MEAEEQIIKELHQVPRQRYREILAFISETGPPVKLHMQASPLLQKTGCAVRRTKRGRIYKSDVIVVLFPFSDLSSAKNARHWLLQFLVGMM